MSCEFIKVGAYAPKIQVANPNYNADAIIQGIKSAQETNVRLLCFPELVLTGCTCDDLFFQPTLIQNAVTALHRIIYETKASEVASVIGMPLEHNKMLYNVAVVVKCGRILGVVPNLRSNPRYFSNAPQFEFGEVFSIEDFTFSVAFGTDSVTAAAIECRLDSAYEIFRSAETRKTALSSKNKTIVYANAGMGESTTDFVFSGQCLVFESGKLLDECKPFENIMAVAEINRNPKASEPVCFEEKFENTLTKKPFIPNDFSLSDANELINIQAQGLAQRASHINAKSLVLGISGGLDSTLALLASVKAAEILGKGADFVHAISMPCFGTSNRTKGNAKRLCELLKVKFEEIDISDSVTQHLKEIRHDFNNKDVVFENAQARMRTLVLMNIANAENGLVVGTGDLSELVLGFCTYNGDHMSMYGVNGSIPKTLMQAMVKAFADNDNELKAVLYDILETPISPELLPGNGEIVQITQNLIGSYDLNDFFIFHVLHNHFSPKKVYDLALNAFEAEFSPDEINRWLIAFYKRFFGSQFKRSCLPDGPQATVISVSPRGGLLMPSDALCNAWINEIGKLD